MGGRGKEGEGTHKSMEAVDWKMARFAILEEGDGKGEDR